MSTTVRKVLERTLVQLSQVPGASVQLYSQDTIIEYIKTQFDMYFDEYHWPQYEEWTFGTLDGTLGVITRDLTITDADYTRLLLRYEDIYGIYPSGTEIQLPEAPMNLPPRRLSGGTAPMFIRAYSEPSKLFRVVPYTAMGEVDIHYRARPTEININTVIYLDETLLSLAATYMYLSKDGTNDANTQELQAMLATREGQLASQRAKPIPLSSSRRMNSVTRWW
jgi:hypothetical protein